MRTFALLLVLVNVCFLFWSQYIDTPEPIVGSVSTQTEISARRLQLASERPKPSAAAHNDLALLSCISIGPFGDGNDINDVQDHLQAAGFNVSSHNEQGEMFAGYWVSLPSFSKRADAEQALIKLHNGGISDAYLLADDTPPNIISLGLFSEQSHAERRRDDVAQLGFQAQIQNRTRMATQRWLDVILQHPGQVIDSALLQPQVGAIMRLETRACSKASDPKG